MAALAGRRHALALANGSVALDVALRLAGVQRDDEVLVSAFSYIATTNSIFWQGARPIFCDIDPVTLNVDLADARARLTPTTPAFLVADYCGSPPDYDALEAFYGRILGQHRLAAAGPHRFRDLGLGAGYDHRAHTRLVRPAPDMDDHRHARDRCQRLAGQACRAEPSRDQNDRTRRNVIASGRGPRLHIPPRALHREAEGAAPCRKRGRWSTHPMCAAQGRRPMLEFWEPTRI